MTTAPAPSTILDTPVPHIDIHEDEVQLLLDTTGSMNEPITSGSRMTKWAFVYAAFLLFVPKLESMDSQAKDEGVNAHSKDKNEEAGGILTIAFSGGTARELGDINSQNMREKLDGVYPDGSTYIMPAIQTSIELYREEFGKATIKPHLILPVITDGKLDPEDYVQFSHWLEQVTRDVTVAVAVVGSDNESIDAADQWSTISRRHPNVTVTSLHNQTDPVTLSNWLVAQFK